MNLAFSKNKLIYGRSNKAFSIILWTPEVITTSAWYDASHLFTITQTAGKVSQWADKSGNNRHATQGTGINQPTTGTRTMNNRNVLDFDGGDFMSTASIPSPGGNLSIFMVAIIDSISTTSDAIMSYNAVKGFDFASTNASQFYGIVRADSPNTNYTLTGGPYSGPSIYNVSFVVSTLKVPVYIDGTLKVNGSYLGAITNGASVGIFCDQTTVYRPNGAVAEVVVLSTVDTSTRQKIEGYLAWKWGLVNNLPSDHPYKYIYPTI